MLYKLTQMFLFHFLTCTHSTHTLYLCVIDEWGSTEGKGAVGYSSSSFISAYKLVNTGINSRKGYDRVPWSFAFLHMLLPSSCVQSKFWFEWEAWLLRPLSICSRTHRVNTLPLCSIWLSLCALWVVGPSELCLWDTEKAYVDGWHDTTLLCAHAALLSHWISLTKHKCKDIIISNLKMVRAENLNQVQGLFEHRTLMTCHTLMKVVLLNIHNRCLINMCEINEWRVVTW